MNTYATLAQIRAYLEASNSPLSKTDDGKLTQYAVWSSRLLDRRTHRHFYPRSETRHFDYPGNSWRLFVDDDLLEVTTLAVAGSSIASANYLAYPLTSYPKYKIEIKRTKSTIFTYTGTPQDAVTVLGVWGYHDDWDNAWADSQDEVEDDPLSSSATTLTVNNIDGADANGFFPRLSAGDLLKIESEYVIVTATDTSTNTATVKRSQCGTTAAEHVQDTTIYRFVPYIPATTAVLDLTKWLYEHRSATGGIIALPSLRGTAIQADVDKILALHDLPVRPPSIRSR